jgi:hypothetical protein
LLHLRQDPVVSGGVGVSALRQFVLRTIPPMYASNDRREASLELLGVGIVPQNRPTVVVLSESPRIALIHRTFTDKESVFRTCDDRLDRFIGGRQVGREDDGYRLRNRNQMPGTTAELTGQSSLSHPCRFTHAGIIRAGLAV